MVRKKSIKLGRFDAKEAAYGAYIKAAQEHFGVFSRGDIKEIDDANPQY